MEQVTQQNAALVEQAAAAAQSLEEQAQNLTQVVSQFRLDGAGNAAMAVRKPEKVSKPVAKAAAQPVSAAKPARAALRKREPKIAVQPVASVPVAPAAAARKQQQPLAVAGGSSDADWETF